MRRRETAIMAKRHRGDMEGSLFFIMPEYL